MPRHHNIRQISDPLLHQPVAVVDLNQPDLHLDKTLAIMRDSLNAQGGIGIAANQCAQIKNPPRVMIVGIYDEALMDLIKKRYPDRPDPPHAKIMINPRILSLQGDPYFPGEGCMSIVGGMRAKIGRYPKVDIEYLDEHGKKHHHTFSDFVAHIVQHEYDHLDGIIYLQKAFTELSPSDLNNIQQEINRELQRRQKLSEEPEVRHERLIVFDRDDKERLIVVDDKLTQSIANMPSVTLEGINRMVESQH